MIDRRVLHNNSRMLVEELESLSVLENRFSDIRLVNLVHGEKVGNFSLVFRALDRKTNNAVALKFFDQDPAKQCPYRLLCFDREQALLWKLRDAPRCLQIVEPLRSYEFLYGEISVAAKYFVTEWLSADIDEYFYEDAIDPLQKLYVFNDILLAVESLHNRAVFHRDLKVNNFRARQAEGDRVVVAIDLGTAASFESKAIMSSYGAQAGHLQYSSPEAICGLAAIREIAILCDVYALGCLLYELFSSNSFYAEYRTQNADFDLRLMAIQSRISPSEDSQALLAAWDSQAAKFLAGLSSLKFAWTEDGKGAPPAIIDLLNRILARMTAPNFRNRERSLQRIRALVRSCITCMENERLAKRRAEEAREWRLRRREKAVKRIEKIQMLVGGDS